MPRTTKAPKAYPKHFFFQRIKMALGFCGYCSSRSRYDMEVRGVTDDVVNTMTPYKVCQKHSNEFAAAMISSGGTGTVEYSVPVTLAVGSH